MGQKESPIRTKSFEFAVRIVAYCDQLKAQKDFELSRQLLRSGTSIGANVREAQRGVSSKDFAHKLGIALKEADETKYWLELLIETGREVPHKLNVDVEELIKILVSILKTYNSKL